VSFGEANGTSFSLAEDNKSITVTVPAFSSSSLNKEGLHVSSSKIVDIVIFASGGGSSSSIPANFFNPVIVGGSMLSNNTRLFTFSSAFTYFTVTPSSGPTTGGTQVTISGFSSYIISSITFGSSTASFIKNDSLMDHSLIVTSPPHNVSGLVDINIIAVSNTFNLKSAFTYTAVCFLEGSNILTQFGYVPIENLRKGDLIKTLNDGFVPIHEIGKKEIHHSALVKERIKDQLYKCSPSQYPELFEDLVITGCHSILVDDFVNEQQREKVFELMGDIYLTDDKYRLPACVDDRAFPYEKEGTFTIYHLALDHENYYMNYGIFANGLLVETCSKRYLKELSNMELIE
jgi:hypothetical protein